MDTTTATDIDLHELSALLHLASPALPIGAFSYSQGLEAAVESGLITDAATAGRWIGSQLQCVFARCEAPLLALQWRRWRGDDFAAVAQGNAWLLASRESAELRAETEQMGWSLAQLALALGWGGAAQQAVLATLKPVALPTVFAYAAIAHDIGLAACLNAYAFSWLENQVAAALKAVPLGQLAAQKLIVALRAELPAVVARAIDTPAEAVSTFAPHLAILSARHENQYSRLFRS